MKSHQPYNQRMNARGVTLIEALVALLVMSFGMMALIGLSNSLRRSSDLAKQRGEAMRLAESEISKLRDFSVLSNASGGATAKGFDQVVVSAAQTAITPANSNTTFYITRDVSALASGAEPAYKTVEVKVTWTDRTGQKGSENLIQRVVLSTIISRTDPVFSGSVGIAPPAASVRQPSNRNPVVPSGAKDLGGGISSFQPGGATSPVWIFNNLTGAISGVCNTLPANTTALTFSAENAANCNTERTAYLVSGTVRFSRSNPPLANPSDVLTSDTVAMPLAVSLQLTLSEYINLKNPNRGSLMANRDYPTSPPSECFNDSGNGDVSLRSFVNYYCIVYPNDQTPRNWWGKVVLEGIPLGASADQFKVCRYSADYNGNGYIYSERLNADNLLVFLVDNEEHPDRYRGVTKSLARQNFLVIRGNLSCPTASAVNVAATPPVFVDYSTLPLN
jgi:Tfp pilus assembly protein PilV